MARRYHKHRSDWRLMLALLAAGTLVALITQAGMDQPSPWSLSLPTLSISGHE